MTGVTFVRPVNSPTQPAIMLEGAMLKTAKEAGMNRHAKSPATGFALTLVALSGTLGCQVDNATAFIEGIMPILMADGCVVDAGNPVFTSGALLDIGRGGGDTNALVVAARVVINLPNTFMSSDKSKSDLTSPNYPNYGYADNNTITFSAAEVYLSTDADRDGEPVLAQHGVQPIDENTARTIGVGGTLYNTQSQLNTASAIITTAITKEDAGALQAYVAASGSGRANALVNLRLTGTTSGAAEVRTPPFVFPVELCQGCLVQDAAECVAGQALLDTGCVRGVDYPTVCQ